MSNPENPPIYVYKIITIFPSDLDHEEPLPLSDLDQVTSCLRDNPPAGKADSDPDTGQNDGLIHLSTAAQVPATVGWFFRHTREITLLEIPLKNIEAKIKWEASGSHGVIPHVYGDLFGRDIFDKKTYTVEDTAGWAALLEADTSILR